MKNKLIKIIIQKKGYILSDPGFTLIELMVVVSIISVLAVAVVGISRSYSMKARDTQRMSDLTKIGDALDKYYADYGVYAPPLPCAGAVGGLGNTYWYTSTVTIGGSTFQESPPPSWTCAGRYNYLAYAKKDITNPADPTGPKIGFIFPDYIDQIPKDPRPARSDSLSVVYHHYRYLILKNRYEITIGLEDKKIKANQPYFTCPGAYRSRNQIWCTGECNPDSVTCKNANKVYTVGSSK